MKTSTGKHQSMYLKIAPINSLSHQDYNHTLSLRSQQSPMVTYRDFPMKGISLILLLVKVLRSGQSFLRTTCLRTLP